jgi:hypothetical protein
MSTSITTTPRTSRTTLMTLLAVAAATAALVAPPLSHAAAETAPASFGISCLQVRWYEVYNPSMNKPRGHQDAPDHRHWDQFCI